MVRCNRCDGYVSRDYARVFGNNHDQVSECPNCPVSWQEQDTEQSEESDRKLTFRMSEFELDESSEPDESTEENDSVGSKTTRADGPFSRVGRAVSGLF